MLQSGRRANFLPHCFCVCTLGLSSAVKSKVVSFENFVLIEVEIFFTSTAYSGKRLRLYLPFLVVVPDEFTLLFTPGEFISFPNIQANILVSSKMLHC